MSEFYFPDFETYRLIRRQYIDSLISSMINLQTDPEVVVWIDRLKGCRSMSWDRSVDDIIRHAMAVYNNKFIYYNGGGTFSDTAKEAARRAAKGLSNILGLREKGSGQGPVDPGTAFQTFSSKIGGDIEDGGYQGLGGHEMRSALQMELVRMKETEARLRNFRG
jgi:hypothetical protein